MAQKDRGNELLSMDRAARIILPQCGGSLDVAKENIRTAIKSGRIPPRSSRPSPDNADSRFHRQESPQAWWFEHENETALLRGIVVLGDPADELEGRNRWLDYLNKGGLIFMRSEIESLIAASSWEEASNANIQRTERLSSNWNFPQALAWVATRSFEQATQINCDRQWDRKREYEERIAASMRVFQEVGQKRSLGWLIHCVSMKRCKCGAALTDDREAWETCCCTVVAFDALIDAINVGKLSAYDEIAAAPIGKDVLPALKLDPTRFELKTPSAAGSITLRRADVVRLFPADIVQTTNPVSPQDLQRWYANIPNPEALAIDEQLVPMAKAAFPDKIVSRDKVRALAGSGTGLRKTGPKRNSATN